MALNCEMMETPDGAGDATEAQRQYAIANEFLDQVREPRSRHPAQRDAKRPETTPQGLGLAAWTGRISVDTSIPQLALQPFTAEA